MLLLNWCCVNILRILSHKLYNFWREFIADYLNWSHSLLKLDSREMLFRVLSTMYFCRGSYVFFSVALTLMFCLFTFSSSCLSLTCWTLRIRNCFYYHIKLLFGLHSVLETRVGLGGCVVSYICHPPPPIKLFCKWKCYWNGIERFRC